MASRSEFGHRVDLALADPGLEDQHRRTPGFHLIRVAEVFEYLRDRGEKQTERLSALIGLEYDRTAEDDLLREEILHLGEVLRLCGLPELIAEHMLERI